MEKAPDKIGGLLNLWSESRLFVGAGVASGAALGRAGIVGYATSGGFLLFFAGLADESFAREADLIALDGEHFHEDLVAQLQFIANVADAMLGDFADVQQAVGAGEKLDESAELRQPNDFAEISLADFGAGGDIADHLQSRIAAGSARGEDVHGAVFEDVDLDAGGFDNGSDLLAARTDEVADLVGRDVQFVKARSIGRNLRARRAESFFHDVENLQARFFCLCEGFAHHGDADTEDLDVHLERGDAVTRAGDFEVHVAIVVFSAGDVREDGILVVVTHDEAHGDTRAGGLHRDTGIHQGERAAADSGHRRGTIGFQDVGNEAHGVREVRFGGKQIHERAFGESAVTNLAAARAAQEFHFANAERREIVVQHEALELVLLEEQVEALHVFLGAESESSERLSFAAREESGTVDAREQADFAGDLANLIEGAAIGAAAGVQNVVAEDILAEALKGALAEGALLVHLLLWLFGNR